MRLSLIVAASENNVIGIDGGLPWSLPDDMKRFKELTRGKPVIMGRKTYESIPAKFRPLPERVNIVVTRQREYAAPGCMVVASFNAAVDAAVATGNDHVFVIGGGEIYREALVVADAVYLTRVHTTLTGDVTFPALSSSEWREVSREEHPADDRHAHPFEFLTYERTQ
jgi:dihydrofolate reductase